MRSDRVRQVVVVVATALAIAAAAWGSGAFGGTPMQEAAGGALAPDATLLAAATPAFRIWSVIYLGLAAFAVVQALPSRAAQGRYRAASWWILASIVLNSAWIAVVQAGWLWVSVPILFAIVAVLVVAGRRLTRAPDGNRLDRTVTDVTVGIYLGWALVASAANVAAAVELSSTAIAAVMIVIVLAIATALVLRLRPRTIAAPMAFAAAWGLTWVGVARLEAPENSTVAMVAFVAAALALAGGVWALTRRDTLAAR